MARMLLQPACSILPVEVVMGAFGRAQQPQKFPEVGGARRADLGVRLDDHREWRGALCCRSTLTTLRRW